MEPEEFFDVVQSIRRRVVDSFEQDTLIEAIAVVALVLLVFLWNARTAMISLVAIPLSLLVGVLVFRVFGAFFFGAADKLESALRDARQLPEVLILRMREVVAIDATGINALEDMHHKLRKKGKHLILCGPHTQPLFALDNAGFLDAVGRPRTWPEGHRSDVRWVLSAKHLAASAGEVRRGRLGRKAALGTLRPPVIDGVWSATDPKPGLDQMRRLITRRVK